MKPVKKRWDNLAVFEREEDARTLATFLQNHGFESRTFNDRLLQLFLFLCPPHATYRAQVRLDDIPAARELIARDNDASLLVQRALRCPSCDSFKVQYPQMTRRFITPTIMLNLGIIFRLIEHEAYCVDCHYVWNLPKAPKHSRIKKVA
jgi:hypothetical protein